MPGEKKSTELSSRLGVKRSKPPSTKLSMSHSPAISAPPKAAIATAKPKKDETQRRKNLHLNPFNDMLHHRSSKEKERASTSCEDAAGSEEPSRSVKDDTTATAAAERIQELEQALSAAMEEQKAMREDLTKLREHGLVYRETIQGYRKQLAGTYHQTKSPPGAFHSDSRPTSSHSRTYDTELAPQRSLNQQRTDLAEQVYDLRAKVEHLQDQLVVLEATHQSKLDQAQQSRHEDEWNELTARLHATEKESQERLQQLLSLKSSISSLTRIESQATDSELSDSLSQLSNRVREWVISNFRRTKLDLSNIPLETVKALEGITPTYRTLGPSDRLALFQGLVSVAMMRIFHEPVIVGLPQTGPLASLRHVAAIIHDTGADYCDWRRATIRSLQRSEAKHALEEEKSRLMHCLAGDVLHQLFTLTSASLPSEAQSTLKSILNVTAEFQNTLLLQKAQYRVQFFRSQAGSVMSFDDMRMESINDLGTEVDEDSDTEGDRTFQFCVFPCLEKFGDEYGENAEVSNVLLKARVWCNIR